MMKPERVEYIPGLPSTKISNFPNRRRLNYTEILSSTLIVIIRKFVRVRVAVYLSYSMLYFQYLKIANYFL